MAEGGSFSSYKRCHKRRHDRAFQEWRKSSGCDMEDESDDEGFQDYVYSDNLLTDSECMEQGEDDEDLTLYMTLTSLEDNDPNADDAVSKTKKPRLNEHCESYSGESACKKSEVTFNECIKRQSQMELRAIQTNDDFEGQA